VDLINETAHACETINADVRYKLVQYGIGGARQFGMVRYRVEPDCRTPMADCDPEDPFDRKSYHTHFNPSPIKTRAQLDAEEEAARVVEELATEGERSQDDAPQDEEAEMIEPKTLIEKSSIISPYV